MLRAVKKKKKKKKKGRIWRWLPEINCSECRKSMLGVWHRPSLTRLPLAFSRILSISGSHTDIPIPLKPFMNWTKTKRASVIPLHQHKTDNHFLFGCNHVAILIQTTKIVTFPFTLSTHVRIVYGSFLAKRFL